jgi:hypothetical protein
MADTVAQVFCRLWRATLIRNDEQQRNFDSSQPGFCILAAVATSCDF